MNVLPINLKTNIAICLAVLLMFSMALIGFVMIITAQKALVRSRCRNFLRTGFTQNRESNIFGRQKL